MEAKLDYLRFTYKIDRFDDRAPVDQFYAVFPEFKSEILHKESDIWEHYQHYDYCKVLLNKIMIFYSDSVLSNNGVCCSIPSQGLWIIKELFGIDNFVEFFRLIVNRGGGRIKFTRIDVCFDDFDYMKDGHYQSASEFWKYHVNDQIVSRCRSVRPVDSDSEELGFYFEQSSAIVNKSQGSTFYLGSRSSDRLLRIYDKYKQSRAEAIRQNDESLFVDSVRYEFELHKKYCNNFVAALLTSNHYTFVDYVENWFRIIDWDTGTRTNTCDLDKKWADFLNLEFSEDLIKTPLWIPEKRPSTVEGSINWLYKDVLPTLAVFGVCTGMLDDLRREIVNYARDGNFKKPKRMLIQEYLNRISSDESVDDRCNAFVELYS